MSQGSEVSNSTSNAKHIMGHLWPKKMSQLWVEIDMNFREYLKCPKKRKVGPSIGQ
jgi:hypothetical protein